ncbi:hypothetical protein [Mesorhizobium sp.]|uniref:hypothetical protein n=1 Tax=Mesorhizobium sp. TaxID=1871066 RepID=UPI000FE8FB1F|nr:hypothetical protein [Mesorhizobium sp.]RWC07718.1 MAG: hypothetical protein EOS53_32710 [Mesorhizobium sp.]
METWKVEPSILVAQPAYQDLDRVRIKASPQRPVANDQMGLCLDLGDAASAEMGRYKLRRRRRFAAGETLDDRAEQHPRRGQEGLAVGEAYMAAEHCLLHLRPSTANKLTR